MRWFATFVLLIASCLAWAHDTSISGLKFILDAKGATVAIQTTLTNIKKTGTTPEALGSEIHLQINGHNWTCEKPNLMVDKPTDNVTLQARIDEPVESLDVSQRLFANDPTTKTIVTVMKDGDVAGQAVLTSEFPSWRYGAAKSSTPQHVSVLATMKTFLLMGIEHILSGPDHLLFIFGLMLARPRIRELVKVATGFTVAHSITLSLCALNIFTLPSRIVEPLIALSIVAVAAEKFFKPDDKVWRTVLIAFSFGLIHGFGFAGALTEAGLPPGQAAVSLASFNIGVELVQISLILVGIPILLWFQDRRPKLYQPATVATAVCISLIGLFWFGERIIRGG
ncbi:MAG: HupE/UreJ family protein [Armatimonadetes bacterium]|nr:HupE/UreJ family protein [Armatimonadota bacterium]